MRWDMFLFDTYFVAIGLIGVSYTFYADQRGWPAGTFFAEPTRSILVDAGGALIFLGPAFVWWREGFVMAGACLVAGFFLAFVLTNILRQYVQWLWVVSMFAFVGAVIFLLVDRYIV